MADSSDTSQPWVCEVSLFKRYKYEGLQASDSANGFTNVSPTAWPTARGTAVKSGATRNRPLGPWVEQHAENFAFATVYTKAEVQEVLYWAQLAILNPSMPFELYVPGKNSNTTAKMQVKFSPNVVRLDVGADPHALIVEKLTWLRSLDQIYPTSLSTICLASSTSRKWWVILSLLEVFIRLHKGALGG